MIINELQLQLEQVSSSQALVTDNVLCICLTANSVMSKYVLPSIRVLPSVYRKDIWHSFVILLQYDCIKHL